MRTQVRRRRMMRGAFFGVIAFGALALVLALRRGPRRPVAAPRVPTGGAALIDVDAGSSVDAIIEDARRYPVRVWSFGLDRYELSIEDAAMSTALDAVLARTGAEFVVNGGFFDPDGTPVGLALSRGAVLSKLAARLSGGVLVSDGARAELIASEHFALPEGSTFAIQCRPRLVVERAANVKSDDTKRAERSALCTREGGRALDVVLVRGSDDGESPGPSLFALARHLAGVGCEFALNLDGGPSTGAAWREGGEVRLLAHRAPVRHVVAFRERH
jgi:hypothetical protein